MILICQKGIAKERLRDVNTAVLLASVEQLPKVSILCVVINVYTQSDMAS